MYFRMGTKLFWKRRRLSLEEIQLSHTAIEQPLGGYWGTQGDNVLTVLEGLKQTEGKKKAKDEVDDDLLSTNLANGLT